MTRSVEGRKTGNESWQETGKQKGRQGARVLNLIKGGCRADKSHSMMKVASNFSGRLLQEASERCTPLCPLPAETCPRHAYAI